MFTIPCHVLKVLGHAVWVRMDRSEAHGHMAVCPGMAEPGSPAPEQEVSKAMSVPEKMPPPDPELVGRINQMLTMEAFVVKGASRACTMCGVRGDVCLSNLRRKGEQAACCPACGNGNTHPAPLEAMSTCAEWGAEHGARN